MLLVSNFRLQSGNENFFTQQLKSQDQGTPQLPRKEVGLTTSLGILFHISVVVFLSVGNREEGGKMGLFPVDVSHSSCALEKRSFLR